ncbi:DNA-binding transcriptional regulator OxyR [Actinobacillus lignieresii]|nr:DNA-binding transcriptional regulator OxyR [Actinobacillus lignieresii]
MLLAVSDKHEWSHKSKMDISYLKDKELLFLDDGHCLRTQTLDYCLSVGAKESTHFKATNLETLRNMVAANVGMSLIPELAAKPCEGLNYLTFDEPKPYRTVGLIYRPGSPLRIRYERLAKEVSKIMKQEKIHE